MWESTHAKRHAEKPEHGDRFSSGRSFRGSAKFDELDRSACVDDNGGLDGEIC